MYVCKESIEIAASPEVVRAKFLDFPQIPRYHSAFFHSIEPKIPNKFPMEVGDKTTNTLAIGKFEATVLENTPQVFRWGGGVSGVFVGNHAFRFEPSTKNPGGTLFVQEEEFHGAFAFVLGDNVVAKMAGTKAKTLSGWAQYNKDLKAWVELAS